MRKDIGFFQKVFGGTWGGSTRVPLRSNVYNRGSSGYQQIGGTGRWGRGSHESPLLGDAHPSNRLTGYYSRHDELKTYQLIDVVQLSVNFFADYALNFLKSNAQQAVTIYQEDGTTIDETKTEKINDILLKDLNIFDFIRQHLKDQIFFGQYGSALLKSRDEIGHLKFRLEELYDPTSIVTKRSKDFREGTTKETYICRADDGKIYEIGENDAWILGSDNLRLVNDLEEKKRESGFDLSKTKPSYGKIESGVADAMDKILNKESYTTAEPLFYSLILKVKELIVKELLVSLISLRDLSSTQIFLLQFDKSTPLETANELCARTTKLANNTNQLASFITAQFDVISFLEQTMSQPSKFVPDYNASLGNKNAMLPLDKLSDKMIEVMQTLDQCKSAVLNPLGIPTSILDSTSGSKWAILQQSERANSKVTAIMNGIRESVLNLVKKIYFSLYQDDIDPSLIKLHITEKTSVEYNNQINQSESINGLVQGITGILQNALQTVDASAPLIDTKAFMTYIQNLLKDIDPDTESIITEETLEMYVNFAQAKLQAMAEQQGIDPSVLTPQSQEDMM